MVAGGVGIEDEGAGAWQRCPIERTTEEVGKQEKEGMDNEEREGWEAPKQEKKWITMKEKKIKEKKIGGRKIRKREKE